MSVDGALKAPFPWFGGKSLVSDVVWQAFGDVPNYVEPFAGSLAVLLGRPHPPQTETVNDLDCYLANFWRAVSIDPDATARHADWPVNEADLHARHKWLVDQADFRERMRTDPDFYDAKIAGWWVWGQCAWIGSGWCKNSHWRQLPHLSTRGVGVNRKLPDGKSRGEYIQDCFLHLQARLRDVRVACGDWTRILSDSVTLQNGITGVFLDPPYDATEHSITYSANINCVFSEAAGWAIVNGKNPMFRIALCGYAGSFLVPDGWQEYVWKANGGYGSQGGNRARDNASRERIWFSPHCASHAKQSDLFGVSSEVTT